jgi:hypothetical protein
MPVLQVHNPTVPSTTRTGLVAATMPAAPRNSNVQKKKVIVTMTINARQVSYVAVKIVLGGTVTIVARQVQRMTAPSTIQRGLVAATMPAAPRNSNAQKKKVIVTLTINARQVSYVAIIIVLGTAVTIVARQVQRLLATASRPWLRSLYPTP